jgi:hypothetical protein
MVSLDFVPLLDAVDFNSFGAPDTHAPLDLLQTTRPG